MPVPQIAGFASPMTSAAEYIAETGAQLSPKTGPPSRCNV